MIPETIIVVDGISFYFKISFEKSDLKNKTPETYSAPPIANSVRPVTSTISRTTIDGHTPTTK